MDVSFEMLFLWGSGLSSIRLAILGVSHRLVAGSFVLPDSQLLQPVGMNHVDAWYCPALHTGDPFLGVCHCGGCCGVLVDPLVTVHCCYGLCPSPICSFSIALSPAFVMVTVDIVCSNTFTSSGRSPHVVSW